MSVVFRKLLSPPGSARAQASQALPGDSQLPLAQLLAETSFGAPPERPWVLLNMIATADGRATIAGRSGPLGNQADRELFHGLRTLVDAVMVGAQTLRTERYNRLVADPVERTRRHKRGLGEEPLACIVSSYAALDPTIPLLADPGARVAILTPSDATIPDVAAKVSYVRAERDGMLDMARCMGILRERYAVRALLCEGGPHLAFELVGAGLLDELFLTLAPKLVGGDIGLMSGAAGSALSILSGGALDPPVALELRAAFESESYLFLRYAVVR